MTDLTRFISFTALAEARLKHLGCSAFAAIVIALRIEEQKRARKGVSATRI